MFVCCWGFIHKIFFEDEHSSLYLTSTEVIISNAGWIWPKPVFLFRKIENEPNYKNSISGQNNLRWSASTYLTWTKKTSIELSHSIGRTQIKVLNHPVFVYKSPGTLYLQLGCIHSVYLYCVSRLFKKPKLCIVFIFQVIFWNLRPQKPPILYIITL